MPARQKPVRIHSGIGFFAAASIAINASAPPSKGGIGNKLNIPTKMETRLSHDAISAAGCSEISSRWSGLAK